MEEQAIAGNSQEQQGLQLLTLEESRTRARNLWDKVTSMKGPNGRRLGVAPGNRAYAESERQRIVEEALEATQQLCENLLAKAEVQLEMTRQKQADAELVLREVQLKVEAAERLQTEAQSSRDELIADAQRRAQEIIDEARHAAQAEANKLQNEAGAVAQQMLAEIEALKGALEDEVEAQRIYTDTVRLKVFSEQRLLAVRRYISGEIHELPSQRELPSPPASTSMESAQEQMEDHDKEGDVPSEETQKSSRASPKGKAA